MKAEKTLCGIVEGFFSRPRVPWSTTERLRTVEFLGTETSHLRLYFYCPKDDPWVTGRWDELYPSTEANDLRTVFSRCRELGIQPVYGLNPNLTLNDLATSTNRSRWIERVLGKLSQAQQLGAAGLALLFDDLPIAYDALDDSLFQSEPIATHMVELSNEVARFFSGIRQFWFCPPDYCFTRRTEISEACRLLDQRIGVLWSGNEIFASEVSSDDIARVETLIGEERPLIWWCNYPVNDCEQAAGEYNLGAFPAVSPAILRRLQAIVVNPMRECSTNFPLYRTFDTFLKAPSDYRREKAWLAALSQDFQTGLDALAKITCMFSARNSVDRENGWLRELLSETPDGHVSTMLAGWDALLTEAESATPCTRYGETFLESMGELLSDARRFLTIAQQLMKPAHESIVLQGRFPTDLTIPRYAPEVAAIASQRLATVSRITGKPLEAPLALHEALEVTQECSQNYVGSARRDIVASDASRYLAAMTDIAREEEKLMEQVLNDRTIPPRIRLLALAERMMINRFRL